MLDFEFCNQENCDIAYYKGYTVKAIRDDNAINPWEDWDNQPPLAVNYDGNIKTYSKEFGDALDPISYYSDGQINRHWKKICNCIGDVSNILMPSGLDCNQWFEQYEWEDKKEQGYTKAEARREFIEELEIKDFDVLETLWKIIGIDALSTVSRGYCQRDYAELLIVFTPDVVKEWGQKKSYYKKTVDKQLQECADLYGYWAWGDVYGYVIKDEKEDHIDSCWGFYGCDHDESGLLGEAESALEYHIKEK